MLSRWPLSVFVLTRVVTAASLLARNSDIEHGTTQPVLPGRTGGAPGHIEIFDPSYAEIEARSILGKYALAADYLSGTGLNPNDIIDSNLADQYSPTFGDSETGVPPPSGHGDDPGLIGSRANAQSSETPSSSASGTGTGQWSLLGEVSGALDILYYGPAHFGTPPQTLTVDVDTGSADLWLPASCGNCHGRQFDAAHSSTHRPSNQDFSITYGTGRVSGKVVTDMVSIAGLAITSQAFGSVNNQSNEFDKQPNDGLIGMAFGTIAQSRQPTFFENLIRERKLAAPLFSVHLARHEERGTSARTSTTVVCLGCVDYNWTLGPVTWLPVVSKAYWTVNMDGLWADGKEAPTRLTAAIDTGTSLIYVPPTIASAFYSLIPGSKRASQFGSGFWTVPCFSVRQIELSFNGHRFAINARDFYLGRVSARATDCVAGILSMGNGLPANLAIIGDEFLKSWYSTYDYGNGARVGFWPDVNNK